MKSSITIIEREIVRNHKNLSKKAKIPYDKKTDTAYVWGLKNKTGDKTVFVSQSGNISIETNKKPKSGNLIKDFAIGIYNRVAKHFDAEIQITNGKVEKIKKPLFMSWSKTLNKINKMVKHTDKNINNKDVVEKSQIGLLCFSKKAVKRLQEINSNLAKK